MRIVNKNIIAKEIFDDLYSNKVLLTYFGALDFGITDQMIKHLSGTLIKDNLNKKQFNKVYSAFVEGVENAYKHQKVLKENTPGIIICSKNGSDFHAVIGNTIYGEDRIPLINLLDFYSKLGVKELKNLIAKRIMNVDIEKEASPKVGLLRVFNSSESQVSYSFKELENGELLFLLNFKISID